MPYKSDKQKRLILAAAHNKKFADKVGFKQEAAQKFMKDAEGKVERFSKIKKKLKK